MTITQGTQITDGTAQFIVNDITDGIPVGDVVFRPYLKDGYLACKGQEVNRSDYPRLVELADKYSLWTDNQSNEPYKFGEGNGSTTMLMPNYLERVVWGGSTAGKREAGLPNIKAGSYENFYNSIIPVDWQHSNGEWVGAVRRRVPVVNNSIGSGTTWGGSTWEFDASHSNKIYGNSTTVQPPAIVLIPQMKY